MFLNDSSYQLILIALTDFSARAKEAQLINVDKEKRWNELETVLPLSVKKNRRNRWKDLFS